MGEGWGMLSSSNDGTVPIACASLVANATGSKMTKNCPLYTFCLYRVNHIDCHISHNSEKEQGNLRYVSSFIAFQQNINIL